MLEFVKIQHIFLFTLLKMQNKFAKIAQNDTSFCLQMPPL